MHLSQYSLQRAVKMVKVTPQAQLATQTKTIASCAIDDTLNVLNIA
jgi:hypothetical protein